MTPEDVRRCPKFLSTRLQCNCVHNSFQQRQTNTCSEPVSAAFPAEENPRKTSAMISLVSVLLGVVTDLTACKAPSCRFDSSATPDMAICQEGKQHRPKVTSDHVRADCHNHHSSMTEVVPHRPLFLSSGIILFFFPEFCTCTGTFPAHFLRLGHLCWRRIRQLTPSWRSNTGDLTT